VFFSFFLFPVLSPLCLSTFASFSFSFLEFINGVCGLRWMCCGGIVAYYIECANVVKKWYRSDCDNQGYQGRRGWVFKLRTPTRRAPCEGPCAPVRQGRSGGHQGSGVNSRCQLSFLGRFWHRWSPLPQGNQLLLNVSVRYRAG